MLESNNKPLDLPLLDRRRFLSGSAAVAGGLVAASMLGGAARAAVPKKGGVLRAGLGHGATTDTLDPATASNFFQQALGSARQNSLTEIAPDGSLVGELAASWESSPDAKTRVFQLRKGVEFHNGKSFEAEDVIASINHHRGKDSKSAAKPIVAPIVDIKADGKDRVVFTLEAGNADFPYIMADYHLSIMPAKDGVADWQSGVGTGGYVLKHFEPGVSASVERFANYWKPNAAHFDAIELLSITDSTARTNALSTGEIDVMDKVDLKTARLLARRKGLRVVETSGTQHYTFAMSTNKAPFTDNNVRLALKHAIDREALVKIILNGFGTVGNDHPIGRSNKYFATDLEQRVYDPDKARYYLKQAGLDSLTVPLSVSEAAFNGAIDAAVLYKEQAAQAGIDIEVVREPSDGYWSNVWMKKSWSAVYWGGRPTEDWMFTTTYAAGAPWNDTFWENERFNKLLVEARSELDENKRREMYGEMQRLCRDDGGALIPMFANYVFAMSDKVQHGPNIAANWDMDGWKFSERWWFA